MLEAIVHRLPAPKGDLNAPLKALLVDSWYDVYLGVVVLIRVIDGTIKKGQKIRMMNANASYELDRVGVFTPKLVDIGELGPGEIGFFTASIKEVADTNVGDTITDDRKPTATALPGFRPAQPVVFCGLFPVDASDFDVLREAMGKLRLNDASFCYEMETSRRARLRLPLRLSRAPAPRDHPGAAGARVQPRSDRHRPERDLRDARSPTATR